MPTSPLSPGVSITPEASSTLDLDNLPARAHSLPVSMLQKVLLNCFLIKLRNTAKAKIF